VYAGRNDVFDHRSALEAEKHHSMTVDPKINPGFFENVCFREADRRYGYERTRISTRSHHGADDVCGKPRGLER
jgi:hypothetical protein